MLLRPRRGQSKKSRSCRPKQGGTTHRPLDMRPWTMTPGVPAGRRRLGHATALDAGDLLPFKLRLPIHHTSLRLHRGRPRPRQHADWLRHRCVTTASFCCRSPPRLGLIRRGLRCGQASGENAARSAPCPRSRMAQPFVGAGLK
jgi:hypothetical protein